MTVVCRGLKRPVAGHRAPARARPGHPGYAAAVSGGLWLAPAAIFAILTRL